MTALIGKGPGALALPVTAGLRHGDRRIIVQDRQRHAAEEGERRYMPVEERLSRLARISIYKAGIRCGRTMHRKWIFWYTADHADRLAKIDMRMSRQVC